MAEETLNAIVLRRRDSGETDRRLIVLSLERGKTEVVAKGARKAGSRLAGSSDPLTVARLSVATGKRNAFITQTQPLTAFRGLRADYSRLSFALALCELYAAVLPWEEPFAEAYELLMRSLQAVQDHEKPLVALIWSELQLLRLTGFLPAFNRSAVSGDPLREGEPWVSPHAGGYVGDAEALRFTDRFRSRAEALLGLAKLTEQEEPPANLRFAEECLWTLLPFWRQIAEAPLPANEACVAQVRHANPEAQS